MDRDFNEIKIGVALGAGGLRGLAHLGVLDVLKQAGVRVDCISGCSMGSVVASLFACGVPLKMLEEMSLHLDEKTLFELTTPKRGFIRGDKFESLMKTLTADRTFADLKFPLSVIATDYTHATCATFRTGDPEKIYRAVHASCAIPGVFVPVRCRGTDMVDGGLISRLPIGECRDMGADVVIAVDVGLRGETDLPARNIIEIINTSFEILQWQITQNKTADGDIVVRPDVFQYDILRFRNQETIIEAGRKAAREMLPAILARLAAAEDAKTAWLNSI